jgi:hypothetical protein
MGDGDRRLMQDSLTNTRALLGRAVDVLSEDGSRDPIKARLLRCYVEALGPIPAAHRLETLPADLAFEVRDLRARFAQSGTLVGTLDAMTEEDAWHLASKVYRVHRIATKARAST